MATQYHATTKLIERMLAKRAARQPQRAHYDSRGRRDTAYTSGVIIGSQTPVDCSYCLENTEVEYTPPVSTE